MGSHDLVEALRRTLDDVSVTRSERRALSALLDDEGLSPQQLGELRHAAFDLARDRTRHAHDGAVLDWLEDIVKLLTIAPPPAAKNRVHFSPGRACRDQIVGLLRSAGRQVEICVYTITDDRISSAILEAHGRGVHVRVLTDVGKSRDPGSDIDRLARAGVTIAVDTSDKYMHHKFAIFDEATLLTGSYNWTRSAAEENEENLVVSDDPSLVRAFGDEFARLWEQYAL